MTRLLLAATAAVAAGAPAGAEDLKAKVDPLAEALVKGRPTAGLVVGVWAGGKPHVFGYGTVFTPARDGRPDGKTVFEIGSITKAFTGVLLAEAVRRGEVKLDDPANAHLPPDLRLKPHKDGGPVSLLDLATHRSGLPPLPPDDKEFPRDEANPYAGFDRSKLAKLLAKLTPDRPPGKEFEYSNFATGVLGQALVHAAKADSYNALVVDRVCKPLGMRDTTEALTGAQRARLADGHGSGGRPAGQWDFAALEAAGGLKSTCDDLLRVAAAAVGDLDSPVGPALADSRAPRRPVDKGVEIGLFWMNTPLKKVGVTHVWHNGGTGGYRSMLTTVPATKTGVVVLCSAADEAVDGLAVDLIRALHPPPPPAKAR